VKIGHDIWCQRVPTGASAAHLFLQNMSKAAHQGHCVPVRLRVTAFGSSTYFKRPFRQSGFQSGFQSELQETTPGDARFKTGLTI